MWTRCPLELIDETWEIENEQDGVCLPKYHSHELLESGENVTNQTRKSYTMIRRDTVAQKYVKWSKGFRDCHHASQCWNDTNLWLDQVEATCPNTRYRI